MHRITNNLFESIKEVISVDKEKEPVLLNEKVEELDELKKSTLGNYIKRASSDAANKMHDASAYASIATNAQKTDASSKEWMSAAHKLSNKAQSRLKGIDKATDKLTKEEAEELDELDKSTLGSYVKKASGDVQQSAYRSGLSASKGVVNNPTINKTLKRRQGIAKAVDRLTSEAEKLDTRGVAEDFEVDEATGVTNYNPKSQGGTRKELLAKYHKTKDSKDAEAARKAGATQKELQGVAEGRFSLSGYSHAAIKQKEMKGELGHEDRPGFDPKTYADRLRRKYGSLKPPGGPEASKHPGPGTAPMPSLNKEEMENNMPKNNKKIMEFVIENIIQIEIPDNLTYQDYLDAVNTIVNSNDENDQQEIVTIANEAFENGNLEIIAEAELIRSGILEARGKDGDRAEMELYRRGAEPSSGRIVTKTATGTKYEKVFPSSMGVTGENQRAKKAREERNKRISGRKDI